MCYVGNVVRQGRHQMKKPSRYLPLRVPHPNTPFRYNLFHTQHMNTSTAFTTSTLSPYHSIKAMSDKTSRHYAASSTSLSDIPYTAIERLASIHSKTLTNNNTYDKNEETADIDSISNIVTSASTIFFDYTGISENDPVIDRLNNSKACNSHASKCYGGIIQIYTRGTQFLPLHTNTHIFFNSIFYECPQFILFLT